MRSCLRKEDNLLFFGCREETENILESETEDMLTRIPAFSRQPGQPKKYVQDAVEEYGERIVDLVWKKQGYLLVCGTVSVRFIHYVSEFV